MMTTEYPEFGDWQIRDEWSDDDLLRVFALFATAVNEQDEGRDIGGVIDLYRQKPDLRPMIDMIMVALTGWQLSTIVTGMTDDGRIPDGFEKIRYFDGE